MLIAAVSLGGLAATGCAEQSAAVRVGDDMVSQSDFEAELDAYASSESFVPDPAGVAGALPGSYSQEFVAAALNQRIEFMLAQQVFDDEGFELSESDVSLVADQVQDSLDGIPADLRRSLIEDVARQVQLQRELGVEGYGRALTEAADRTEIHVSTHYGSWDPERRTVVPPDGPAPEPGRDGTSGDGAPGG